MKILFICGSFEKNRDGVGDYTRILAIEVMKLGHRCSILALNDKYIDQSSNEKLLVGDQTLEILRLTHRNRFDNNSQEAKHFITHFNPDWISFQYVPYAFNNKGLLFGFSKIMKQLIGNHKFQIMFHELWSGMNRESSLKLKMVGLLQKWQLISFLNRIKPELLHTQSTLYRRLLEKSGFKVSFLPLFSNIKVTHSQKISDPKILKFIVFGSIHPEAPIRQFVKHLAEFISKNNLTVNFTFIGQCGEQQEVWASIIQDQGIDVIISGEQSEENISIALTNSTFGVTSTPVMLVEKSGSVAAMQAHNLPVICISRDWRPSHIENIEIPEGVIVYKPDTTPDFNRYMSRIQTGPLQFKTNEPSSVAQQFISSILAEKIIWQVSVISGKTESSSHYLPFNFLKYGPKEY